MKLRKHILITIFFFSICALSYGQSVETFSPNNEIRISFELKENGSCYYSVIFKGSTIIKDSKLGILLRGGDLLGKDMEILNTRKFSLDEVYNVYAGKSSLARNHYNETLIELQERTSGKRKLNIYLRAYDDGAAFRYEIPAQSNINNIEIYKESTEFNFASNASIWAMTTDKAGYNYNYEGKYDKYSLDNIPRNKTIPFPVTVKGQNYYMTISEANLQNYSGMYLKKSTANRYGFESVLVTYKNDNSLSVKASPPLKTPWRVMIIGDEPGDLIESNLVLNLNEPLAISDPSWIKPGRAMWDWWAGWADFNKDFQYGMNTATMKYFVDFAAGNGIEYMQVDATWYGAFDAGAPYENYDDLRLTNPIPEIDLAHLASYANSRGVGLLLWMHWNHVEDQMNVAFPYFEQLGIKGVKIDFMDSDDQQMVNFYHRVVKKAAEHKLLVNFHGAYKPDGLRRTYPNLITREAVKGEEYSKWDNNPSSPEDNVTIPFTRMVIGPMDFTPGGVRPVSKENYSPSHNPPEVLGTQMHQAAKIVVFESPLMTLNEGPGAYSKAPIFELIKQIPAGWDETKVLIAEIGEYIVIARRNGSRWFIGIMTDWNSRNVTVPLDFLPGGSFNASIYTDMPGSTNQPRLFEKKSQNISRFDQLNVYLAPGGGAVIVIDTGN